MRRLVAVVGLVACSGGDPAFPVPSPTPDGTPPARCEAALPSWAGAANGVLIARCGAIEVQAEALADGVLRLRYAAAGEPGRRSWAVVGERAVDPAARIAGDAGAAVVCTDAMTVQIDELCRVRITSADGAVIVEDAEPFTVDGAAQLARHARPDRVYGLGERTGGLDRRGGAWTFWNTDAYDPAHGGWAPGQDPLYQSIPLELHFQGGVAHGVFTDETRRMVFDLGAADPARDTIVASGARALEQYVIAGPKLADVVERYTALTGRPALPPR